MIAITEIHKIKLPIYKPIQIASSLKDPPPKMPIVIIGI